VEAAKLTADSPSPLPNLAGIYGNTPCASGRDRARHRRLHCLPPTFPCLLIYNTVHISRFMITATDLKKAPGPASPLLRLMLPAGIGMFRSNSLPSIAANAVSSPPKSSHLGQKKNFSKSEASVSTLCARQNGTLVPFLRLYASPKP
jgi:hypothetical protein